MYTSKSVSIIYFSILLYACADAAKVIKWPAYEEDERSPTTKETQAEAIQENPTENSEISSLAPGETSNGETTPMHLENTENTENIETQNTQGTVASGTTTTPTSIPPCLADFVGTLLYDLVQNKYGRIVVSAFLNAFSHTMSNSVSSIMYLHISRHIKNLFKDPERSQSISRISTSFTKMLTDDGVFEKFNTKMENFKITLSRPETNDLMESIYQLTKTFSSYPMLRRIVRVLVDGTLSVLNLPDPKNAIIKGFEDLRSYT